MADTNSLLIYYYRTKSNGISVLLSGFLILYLWLKYAGRQSEASTPTEADLKLWARSCHFG